MIQVYRNGSPIFQIRPKTAEQRKSMLTEDIVFITLETPEKIDFLISDYIDVFGEKYKLNQMPTAIKNNSRHYIYNLNFEGSQYDLLRAQYFNVDVVGYSTSNEFSLNANLEGFMNVLISNLNRVFGGVWSLGDCPETSVRNLAFSAENCLSVLQRLCQEFETEFIIKQDGSGNYIIDVGSIGEILPHVYEYGKGKGLYKLERSTNSSKELITRLYAYGSDKNLKSGYRNYSNRLKFSDSGYIDHPDGIAAFGIIEGSKIFDDIKPERKGVITAIDTVLGHESDDPDRNVFYDTSMDFDLNASDANGTIYLLPGVNAKIHFNTGNLAGYEFDLNSYDHTTKRFRVVSFTDERGLQFPNPDSSAFQFNVGDEYVILEINMPESYITSAETKLLNEATEYLNQNCIPRVQYGLEVDQLFLKTISPIGSTPNYYNLGDYIQLKDVDLNIDKASRIIGYSRLFYSQIEGTTAYTPYNYKVTIADSYDITLAARLLAESTEVTRVIKMHKLDDPARAKRNWRVTDELITMFNSIVAEMIASVGEKITMRDLFIEANYQGNANLVNVTAGSLTNVVSGEIWFISGGQTLIDDNAARYIYARCNKSNNQGSIIFTIDRMESDATYTYFLIGALSSVIEGFRIISLSYGFTTINGGFIRTGQIASPDGLTYFTLDRGDGTGEIGGRIVFTYNGQSVTLENWAATFDPGQGDILGDLAYYDTVMQAMQDETIIIGGYINTNFIDVKTLAVNNNGQVLAGITGEGTLATDIRIWAGSTYGNRGSAAFRVQQDGKMFANNAEISGKIVATSGQIGGFDIGSGRLGTVIGPYDNPSNGMSLYDSFIKFADSTYKTFVLLGSQVMSAVTGLVAIARFENKNTNPIGTNYGMLIDVSGGANNIAQKVTGNTVVDGVLTSTKLRIWSPTSGNNTLPTDVNTVLVNCNNSSYTTVYMPLRQRVKDAIGAGTSNFMYRLTINAYFQGVYNYRIYGGEWTLKDWNGNTMSYIEMAKGDTTEWLLYHIGAIYIAQITSRML